jgi:nucleoside diphosphate kinase
MATPPNDPDYAAGAAALHDAVGFAAADVASRAGLVMFTPGCLVAGRLGEGMRHLEDAGFAVAFARRVTLTELQVRQIWRFQSAGFTRERWNVAVRLFCAGPAVVALVTGRVGARDAPVAARLAALKGPSDPAALEAHHLRKRLGALNKLNNLVHTADSLEAVVREVHLTLPPQEVHAAWRAAGSRRTVEDLDKFVEATGAARPEGVSLAHAGVRVLWRAFDLARQSTGTGGPPFLRARLVEQLAWARRESPHDAAEALRRWRTRHAGTATAPALLEWLAAASAPEALGSAYRGVEDILAGRPVALGAFERAIRESVLAVDPWERLLMATEVVSREITIGHRSCGPAAVQGGTR